ncbi:UNVERIFIED_CONTAM: hypothetical protein Sradi_5995400 [Sesamum radiatum]|uniref:Alpha 1,4-glycosyltransferase domain-containing protein n=1 Tax=Sesamum radiatum TaxID=300843 RepID=A0AAW2KI30_SESRA
MGLLYRFGGTYIDTDVIVLKSFEGLRNVIGAQTIDLATGNWSRLNNAVMIFDQGHPLLHKFIEEFALTFDGNKWGHNGPYLVSRVVSRLSWNLDTTSQCCRLWLFIQWIGVKSEAFLRHLKV